MIYVYAIVDDPDLPVADLRGLGGAPLVRFSRERMAAVCSLHDALPLEANPATLWAQERVIAALMARSTVVPARFATVVGDAEHLERVLASQEGGLVATLGHLRGKVELALRGRGPAPAGEATALSPAPPPTWPSGSGRTYLHALRQAHARRPQGEGLGSELANVHAVLGGRAHASTLRTTPDGTMVAAYLVDAGDVECFRRAVGHLSNRHGDVALSLTGPWAPFNFVTWEGGMACA